MSRTPKDYAIEHAEYMAVEAEQLIDALSDLSETEELHEESGDDGDIEDAQGVVTERIRSLLSGIYEFRKRRDRALSEQPAAHSEPLGWATHHDEPMLFPTQEEALLYCDDDEEPIPLYAHPPEGDARDAVGIALAMRVLQSDLCRQLDDAERADCDELIERHRAAMQGERHEV